MRLAVTTAAGLRKGCGIASMLSSFEHRTLFPLQRAGRKPEYVRRVFGASRRMRDALDAHHETESDQRCHCC